MNTRDEQMAQLLEDYLNELEAHPQAQPPQGLDPQMLEAIQKMDVYFDAPEPHPEFVASLRSRVDREAIQLAKAKQPQRSWFGLPQWSFVGIGAAVIIALGAVVLLSTRPAAASAEQVMNKAASVANNLAATGVNTFELTSTSEQVIIGDAQQPIAGMSNNKTRMAYAGPTLWRVQGTTESLGETLQTLNVSDGATLWTYDAFNNIVTADVAESGTLPLPNVGSLDLLKEDWSNCYTPQVVGEEAVAGRAVYKVDLGENKCRSASMFLFDGTRSLWLDKETFFVLRDEFISKDGKQNLGTYEVTKIEYNIDLPKAEFQYTPPPGANLQDNRPKPAPSPEEFLSQLKELAKSADYRLFAPNALPNGLVPRVPEQDPTDNTIALEYVPTNEASTNTLADSHGVVIRQGRATYELVRMWSSGGEHIEVNGNQAWVRRGDFDPQLNTGANSSLILVRDGTIISISSFEIRADQLIEIAKALEPVEGGHAALPNPTPPTLAEIRANAGFPIFVPTYVPEGLTPEPPLNNQIQYHRADGTIPLLVQNAKQGEGGLELDPRFGGEIVKLASGPVAHLIGFDQGVLMIWWHQEDGYISLEGHGLSREEMIKIAESMSSTAELGQTEEPLPPPTPTPIPEPSFTILHPSYLPEEMTVTERKIPGPNLRVQASRFTLTRMRKMRRMRR